MFSRYFQDLSSDARSQYLEKIKDINNIDPYILRKEELSTKLEDFPDLGYIDMVNYLVHGISAYTAEDLKVYKSLQSYIQFKCSWGHDVYVKVFPGMRLVLGKVCADFYLFYFIKWFAKKQLCS